MTSIDLFSGCGGITWALAGYFKTIAYCDKDPSAREVLRGNMERGFLPRAPVYNDIRSMPLLTADVVVGGWPCIGHSLRGKREGFDNNQSGLFFVMLYMIDKAGASTIFLENVPQAVKSAPTIIDELVTRRGFELRWCTMSAGDAGAPHERRRWFCLGMKRNSPLKARVLDIKGEYRPYEWTAEQPARTSPVASAEQQRIAMRRWGLLGNSVVPDVVRLAFLRVFTMGTVPNLEEGEARYVEVSDGTCRASKTGSAITVVTRASGTNSYSPINPISTTSVKLDLVLDPRTVPPPDVRSPMQSSPVLVKPLKLSRWSTPRHGNTGPCRILTERNCRDLPTQIKFERTTRGRMDTANPEFGEYIMGVPRGFTAFGAGTGMGTGTTGTGEGVDAGVAVGVGVGVGVGV